MPEKLPQNHRIVRRYLSSLSESAGFCQKSCVGAMRTKQDEV
jgi:hypothetical protein